MGFSGFHTFRSSFRKPSTDNVSHGLAEAGYGGSLEAGAEGTPGAAGRYVGSGTDIRPVAGIVAVGHYVIPFNSAHADIAHVYVPGRGHLSGLGSVALGCRGQVPYGMGHLTRL